MNNIKYKNILSVDDYNTLRNSVGWSQLCKKQTKKMLKSTTFLVAAKDNKKTVGMARCISDGYIYYIADIVVLPDYQKQGIGTYMVNLTLDYIQNNLHNEYKAYICLLAEKDKENFYKKFGFIERPNSKVGAGMHMKANKPAINKGTVFLFVLKP